MKDNNGDIYSAYLYSDDKKIEIAEYSWAGAQKGDILSTGHYKIAIVKQGESEPKIYDAYDNKPIKLNLNRNSVKVYKINNQMVRIFLWLVCQYPVIFQK